MKRFGIVDCSTGVVYHVYESEESKNSTKYFNYAWTSVEGKCEHIELADSVATATEEAPLDLTTLSVGMIDVQTGTQMVPDGEPREALDDNGDPILDENGDPVMVQDHIEQPVMESVKRVIQSS